MGRGKKPMFARQTATPSASTSRNPAARTRSRKDGAPQLYCSHCLWMTGGGDCHRHGGAAWTDERQDLARLASSERIDAAGLARLAELAGGDDRALFPLRSGLLLAVELEQSRLHVKAGNMVYHYEAPRLLEVLQSGLDIAHQEHFSLLPPEREALMIWLESRVDLDETAVPVGKRHRKSALAS